MASIKKIIGPDGKPSQKYHIWIVARDELGRKKRVHRVGTESYLESKAMGDALEAEFNSPPTVSEMGLSELLSEYEVIRRHRQRSARSNHVKETLSRISLAINHCQWRNPDDIREGAFLDFLAALRAEPEAGRFGLPRSLETINKYITAVKGFTRWICNSKGLARDPLSGIGKRDASVDPRIVRRVLTNEEFERLFQATLNLTEGQYSFRRLNSNVDLAMYLLIASTTGLRLYECWTRTPADFDLDSPTPTVYVPASYAKGGRADWIALSPNVVDLIRPWLATKPPHEPILKGAIHRSGGWLMRKLLAATGDLAKDIEPIPFETYDGRYDCHALRHQFASNLTRTHPIPIVRLMDHLRVVDAKLVMRYTHVELAERQHDVTNLFVPGQPPEEVARKVARKVAR